MRDRSRSPSEAAPPDVMTSASVLDGIRGGDPAALDTLAREQWNELVGHLTGILESPQAAEDATQEAFVRLWENRRRWRPGCARALLFRIARNLAYDERRRERVRRNWAAVQPPSEAWTGPAPDEHAELSEIERRLREAMQALTPGRREIVEFVRIRGLPHKEAARVLGISPQTVANRMTLATADLRPLFAGEMTDP